MRWIKTLNRHFSTNRDTMKTIVRIIQIKSAPMFIDVANKIDSHRIGIAVFQKYLNLNAICGVSCVRYCCIRCVRRMNVYVLLAIGGIRVLMLSLKSKLYTYYIHA